MERLHLLVGLVLAVASSFGQGQPAYWMDACPAFTTEAGHLICASTETANIYSSDGPCKGAYTRTRDETYSSCYCKAQVQVGGCYKTICPTAAMDIYTSSISGTDCASVDFAKMAKEYTPVGAVTATARGGGGGGGAGATPMGESAQPGATTRNDGPVVGPIAGGLVAFMVGVVAFLL